MPDQHDIESGADYCDGSRTYCECQHRDAFAELLKVNAEQLRRLTDATLKIDTLRKQIKNVVKAGTEPSGARGEPIPMILHCPSCGERHIDEGEFMTRPHHNHSCQECGSIWRPAVVDTVGVKFLPGFKNP